MPRYYAPRGLHNSYSRYSVGIYLNDLLFARNYWIDDPYYYRLPPAYGSMRWIRSYDDALLVDTRDGYVVDVIYDFFDSPFITFTPPELAFRKTTRDAMRPALSLSPTLGSLQSDRTSTRLNPSPSCASRMP